MYMRLNLLILFIIIVINSCKNEVIFSDNKNELSVDTTEFELSKTGLCGGVDTSNSFSEYKLSYLKLKVSNLNVFISDDRIDKKMIYRATVEWSDNSGINVSIVDNKDSADVIIKSDYIDGVGGILARAWFPSSSFKRGVKLTPMVLDEDDFFKEGEKYWKNKYAVILHEFGHIFGVRHSRLKRAVMYPFHNEDSKELYIDDVLAIRDKYNTTSDFINGLDVYKFMHHKSKNKVTKNFTEGELVSKCSDFRNKGSYISYNLVKALQRIRTEFGPIKINSTFRSESCNIAAHGATQSSHQLSRAVDFSFYNTSSISKFSDAIDRRDCIFYSLTDLGVTGIAVYDKHIHIDVSTNRKNIWVNLNAGPSNQEM